MTEETHNAARSGPIGIIMSIGVSAILGWFLLLGLLFSIQDYGRTVASSTGEPVTQIFLDTVGEKGAIVLMVSDVSFSRRVVMDNKITAFGKVIVIGAMFFCG
jgi:amino acid transporter